MTALERLYDWFNEQLVRASDEGGRRTDTATASQRSPNIANRQKLFVQEQVKNILKRVGARAKEGDRIVTVRRKSGETRGYLRPVYAEPTELNAFLSEFSRQIPFSVKYGGDEAAFFGGIPEEWRNLDKDVFLCVHRVGRDIEGVDTDEAQTIAQRLTKFWHFNLRLSKIRAGPDPDDPLNSADGKAPQNSKAERAPTSKANGARREADLRKRVNKLHSRQSPEQDLFCVFAGKLTPERKGAKRQLLALCGIYLVQPADWNPGHEGVVESLKHARDLFRGLEVISQLDSKLFELEGLRAMAQLLPTFVDEEIPRSDKISLALSRLRWLLDRHLVGRPEWEGAEQPKLFYLSASFEQSGRNWLPRLEVYPHAYRYEFPLVSLLVSHVRVPSTSKFLLKTYLDENWSNFSGIGEDDKLDPAFVEMFSADKLKIPPIPKWKRHVTRGDNWTCLTMVEHDEFMRDLATKTKRNDPWHVLNRSASNTGDKSRSLLAFVVEGERVRTKWALPRGILALESGAIDAFSEFDIIALRGVIKTFGSLVRLITHDNACLDYRTKLSKAFDNDLYNFADNQQTKKFALLRKFVFSVRKIDGEQFGLLLEGPLKDPRNNHVWELLGLDDPQARKSLYGFIPNIEGVPNAAVPRQARANEIVAKRVEWAIKKAGQAHHNQASHGARLTDELVEFLFACTENFQWSAYLSSIAQVLGDRAGNMVPEFQLMTPGYSASRIFMASVSKELRQVVKLSEYDKLNEERGRYKKYVRYKLVNAARMPVNGFSYDGTGWLKEESASGERTDGYGALVSDLISAAEANARAPIRTFSRLLYDSVIKGLSRSQRTHYLRGIYSLFNNGMNLWREETSSKFKNIGGLMRLAARLPLISGDYSEDHEDFHEQNKRIAALNAALDFYTTIYDQPELRQELLKFLFDPPPLALPGDEFSRHIYQISHRDLNAKNVTWSGALNTFLMIDFEHIGHGYLGNDQIRLWVNAICDLYAEENNRRQSKVDMEKILNAVEFLINATNDLLGHLKERGLVDSSVDDYASKYLEGDGDVENITVIEQPQSKSSGYSDIYATFFVSLFYNLLPKEKRVEIEIPDGMILYGFYCQILKEFEYSRKDLELDKVKKLIDNIPALDKARSHDIHAALTGLKEDFPTPPIRSLYFRHLVAARLLTIVVNARRASK